MDYFELKIRRQQLQDKINLLKRFFQLMGYEKNSWVRMMREALGINQTQLAKLIGSSQPRVAKIENDELDGKVTLETLEKVADAMHMKFVYGFVPKDESLEEIVENRARKIAVERLKRISHSMALEDQGLYAKENKQALENMIQKIMINEHKKIWDS